MRSEPSKGKVLVVRAISGLHVVTLAWDFVEGQEAKRDGLLGFAIERSELDQAGQVIERYYLRGIKRFRFKDEGVPPGTPMPTSEHPIQSFQWCDYTAKPKTTYQYKVVPVYGKPKLLELDDASATTVKITTEPEKGQKGNAGKAIHDVYFNRGVAGSQAYIRKFKTAPDQTQPDSDQMKWLSRGLFEALTGFIRLAAGGDAADYKLRAMLYEFQYRPVGEAFHDSKAAGADVAIRYEAQSYKEENETMITAADIGGICVPQKSRAGIRHNKFIVLIHKNEPVAVWTGSTNISVGGIFGHSNVGHVVWDKEIALRYLDYWERLADPKVTRGPLVKGNLKIEATPARHSTPPADRELTLFSARDDKDTLETLLWYADLMGSAQRVLCMTFAFGLDKVFEEVLKQPGQTLRYAVFDKNIAADVEAQIEQVRNTVIAAGAKLEKGDLENFIGEKLTGFNRNYYIHDKFMLVDPLGDDPVVVTGSANFSGPSQYNNDENMLVIRENTRVADMYFGEFMRIFDHFYSRYIVAKLTKAGLNDPNAGFLKENAKDWVPQHFIKDSRKDLRRRYFMGE